MTDIVYLVRHVAPPEDKRGRYWGKADPGVDRDSLARAGTLPRLAWEKPTRLFASPLARAARTAAVLAEAFRLETETLADVAEVDFGLFDGLTFPEAEQRYPEAAAAWAEQGDRFAFPGGEAVPDFFRRVTDAWKCCRDLDEPAVMVVTHAGVISCWTCLFLGLPLAKRFIFPPAYAALTAFARKKDGTGWNLAFFNNYP